MTMQIAIDFEQKLYQLLNNDQALKALIKNIYLNVKLDNKYPFILVQLKKFNNLSPLLPTYEIEASLSIFTREKSHTALSPIIIRIEELLLSFAYPLSDYYLQNCKLIIGELSQSEDLLTTKLQIDLISLLQKT